MARIVFPNGHETPTHNYPAGVECEVPDDKAQEFLEAGVAESAKPKAAKKKATKKKPENLDDAE